MQAIKILTQAESFVAMAMLTARLLIHHDSQAPDPRAKQGKSHAGKSESEQDIYPRSGSNAIQMANENNAIRSS